MITIASCNLFNFLAPPGAYYEFSNILTDNEWNKKTTWLTQQLRAMNADVVAFQEVFSPDALNTLTSDLGYPYFVCLDTPHVTDEFIYSKPVLAIASRWPVIESRLVRFKDCFGDYSENSDSVTGSEEFSRLPLHAVIEMPIIGLCDVITLHLKSQRPTRWQTQQIEKADDTPPSDPVGSWLSTVQRGWEAVLLSQYIKKIYASHARPMVIMGDFNANINSTELKPLIDESNTPLLKDVRDWLREQPIFTDEAQKATHYHGSQGLILDYLLLSEEFAQQNAQQRGKITHLVVWDKHLVNPSFEIDQFASDHAFVAVTIDALDA
ncbi:TPA: endonuclease/exonuclease/phosphatase family protein [Vibrio vulnificus]|nr:hypothetical protein [Vibrio vulnificus]HDY8012947.1 endonuclease/exonuclease/phosphatase family protein [Vibrio vulnificus]